MSDMIKTNLKELSHFLSLIQSRKKEISKKFDYDSKFKIIEDIKQMKDKSKIIIEKIDKNFEISSSKIRNENKGAIESNKSEYYKMIKEIDKLENLMKKDILLEKTTDTNKNYKNEKEKYSNLDIKIKNQNNNLNTANNMGNEIIDNQSKTMEELIRQRNKIRGANDDLADVEQKLSLHDQFIGVMNNRELYSKLKLVFVIVLLFIADLIVLKIKLFK